MAVVTLLLVVFACNLVGSTAASVSPDRPHIIFAMIDDWGHYNVGFRGNKLIKTPFIDSMIDDSLLLERHYTYKFCSPTRRSFLSGRFPTHSGQDNSPAATVDLRMHTIADKLASAGYSTHQSGKWHAGLFSSIQRPSGRGFYTSLGYMNGACDHWTQMDSEVGCKKMGYGATTDLWNTDRPGFGLNGTYGDYLYVGRAVETIENHNPSVPLFFYLAMQCAHDPMEVPERFSALYDKSTTPNVVEYAFSSVIDEGLANVTAALKRKNMWDNTLLVVSSDNGGPAFSDQHAASNYPLRGGKYTYFEGGLRVTAFVSGGYLPKARRGKNLTAPVHVCDWYATFCGLAGVSAADNHSGVPPIDSLDQWPVISGASSDPVRNSMFPGSGVLYQDPYKLIATSAGTAKWSGPLYPKVPATGPKDAGCSEKTPCLYDIVADPQERNNIAKDHSEVVKDMLARVTELNKGVFEGKGPDNITAKMVCEASHKAGGYLVPADYIGQD
eukprot:m.66817 g.66817  ORF g.66817 m.66817 type:complete len:498 (+) comp13783_c0_seq1:60-1553(+)